MRKISLLWFLGGLIAGLVVGGGAVAAAANYIIGHIISGDQAAGPFSPLIATINHDTVLAAQEKMSTLVYGKVSSSTPTSLTIEATQPTGEIKDFSFVIDAATQFIQYAHDASSTPQQLDPGSIQPGAFLEVHAKEAIGSISNQHATQVISY